MLTSTATRPPSDGVHGERVLLDDSATRDGHKWSESTSSEVPNLKALGYLRGYEHFQLDDLEGRVRNIYISNSASNHGLERCTTHPGAR